MSNHYPPTPPPPPPTPPTPPPPPTPTPQGVSPTNLGWLPIPVVYGPPPRLIGYGSLQPAVSQAPIIAGNDGSQPNSCPQCSGPLVAARATNFGAEYLYCRSCKKELAEMTKPATAIIRNGEFSPRAASSFYKLVEKRQSGSTITSIPGNHGFRSPFWEPAYSPTPARWLPTSISTQDYFLGVTRGAFGPTCSGLALRHSGSLLDDINRGVVLIAKEGGLGTVCFLPTKYARSHEIITAGLRTTITTPTGEAVSAIALPSPSGYLNIVEDPTINDSGYVLALDTWKLYEQRDDALNIKEALMCSDPIYNVRIIFNP